MLSLRLLKPPLQLHSIFNRNHGTNSSSSNYITIAWAMPVSLPQMGARVMSYAQTKAQITTFRLVTKYTTLTSCRNLPEEIISIIANNVRDAVFKQRIKRWTKIDRCLANTCTIMSHVSKADLRSFKTESMITSNALEREEFLEECFEEDAEEEHRKIVRRYCKRLMDLDGTGKIAKGVRVRVYHFQHVKFFVLN